MGAAKHKQRGTPLPGILERGSRRRPDRVGDEICREVASLLVSKIKDPRVAGVTVLHASVTPDLSQARIFYSVLDDTAVEEAAKGLASAKGFLRSSLAKKLALRVVPELKFTLDRSLVEQEKLERIFKEIHQEQGDEQ